MPGTGLLLFLIVSSRHKHKLAIFVVSDTHKEHACKRWLGVLFSTQRQRADVVSWRDSHTLHLFISECWLQNWQSGRKTFPFYLIQSHCNSLTSKTFSSKTRARVTTSSRCNTHGKHVETCPDLWDEAFDYFFQCKCLSCIARYGQTWPQFLVFYRLYKPYG